MIELIELKENDSKWGLFYSLTDSIYQGDQNYVKLKRKSVSQSVNRIEFKNKQLALIAIEGDKVLARMVVRFSKEFRHYENRNVGLISFFETVNRYEAVEILFKKAIEWLKENDVHSIIGPMDGDTWHKYRLNVGPLVRPPFMMEPYNPSYYATFWERFGFKVLAKYFSKYVAEVETVLPKMKKYFDRTIRNGFTYHKFRLDDFESGLKILYNLSIQIFEDNHFYTPVSFNDFKLLYRDSKSIINENLIWFCRDKEDKYCGFVFSFPDYFRALKSMNGKNSLMSKLRFLLNKGKTDTLNIKSLGVTTHHRGSGLGAALMYKSYFEGFKLGFKKANMCLMHEDNASAHLDAGQGEILRNYHLYEYEF